MLLESREVLAALPSNRKQAMRQRRKKQQARAFFNLATDAEGVRMSVKGTMADRLYQGLPEFLQAAGRDYGIRRVQAVHPETHAPITNQYLLLRSNDGVIVGPKNVSKSYAPMSLVDIAAEVQPFCDQGWATPDSVFAGGFLPDGGESVEILILRLDAGGIELPAGEKLVHYMVLINPHNGRKAQGKFISYRPWCKNMFSALLSGGYDFAIPHRVAREEDQAKIMQERIKRAIETWENAKKKIRRLADRIQFWNDLPLTLPEATTLTDRLLEIDPTEKPSTRTQNRREAILAAFDRADIGTHGQSAYDWLNAVTFVVSSPDCGLNATSTTPAGDRMIRCIDPLGSGFDMERSAKILVDSLARGSEQG